VGDPARHGGYNLDDWAMKFALSESARPTPTANDWKGSGPTLERKDGKMRGDRLDYAVEQVWSTPRATDGEKGGPNQSFGAGGIPLPAQTAQWSTPTSLSYNESHQPGNSKSMNETLRLASFLPGQATPTHGNSSPSALLTFYRRMRATTDSGLRSEMRALLRMAIRQRGRGWTRKAPTAFVRPSFRRSLNPCFVAWLMGWPPIASIGFGFSETEWWTWRQRMRSALSQLASPAEAPAEQLSLFA
jgi:hypothetical protein